MCLIKIFFHTYVSSLYLQYDMLLWGPVYTMVEKCTCQSGCLAQDMVIWGKGRYAGEDENKMFCFIQVGVLQRSSFCPRLWGCPRNSMYPNFIKENCRMWTCNRFGLANTRISTGYAQNYHWLLHPILEKPLPLHFWKAFIHKSHIEGTSPSRFRNYKSLNYTKVMILVPYYVSSYF